jgi:hypothetical protein
MTYTINDPPLESVALKQVLINRQMKTCNYVVVMQMKRVALTA